MADVERDKQGRWQPGQSPNPSGKPKGYAEFRAACRERTPQAMDKIDEVLAGEDVRLAFDAAKFIMEQAWGKAPQAITGEGGEGPVLISAKPMSAEEWAAKYGGDDSGA